MNFNNLSELKERLEPALEKRSSDLGILGFPISSNDIWDVLVDKWKSSHNLTLADMVDDILKFMPRWDSEENEK